jgi:hypothetical protein
MSDSLPERPDLGQLRRQAKELRDAVRRGNAAAVERFGRHHPAALQGVASLASAGPGDGRGRAADDRSRPPAQGGGLWRG